jgi:hypothetical protein
MIQIWRVTVLFGWVRAMYIRMDYWRSLSPADRYLRTTKVSNEWLEERLKKP